MSVSISVVTSTLNAVKDISTLIASLRQQTDRAFDFVVVDGASVDGTWGLVKEASDIVTQAISEADSGFYDALNKAIRKVSTDFYLVVGADDVLYPEAIANFRRAVEGGNVDIVVAGVKAGNAIRQGFYARRAWLGHAAMVTSHSVGMLFRTRLHDRFGEYSSRYPMMADGYFIKRACTHKEVRTVAANFIAGEFNTIGMSNRNIARALCETWQIQMETGENPIIQYLLFQLRLLRYLPRVLAG